MFLQLFFSALEFSLNSKCNRVHHTPLTDDIYFIAIKRLPEREREARRDPKLCVLRGIKLQILLSFVHLAPKSTKNFDNPCNDAQLPIECLRLKLCGGCAYMSECVVECVCVCMSLYVCVCMCNQVQTDFNSIVLVLIRDWIFVVPFTKKIQYFAENSGQFVNNFSGRWEKRINICVLSAFDWGGGRNCIQRMDHILFL